MGQGLLPSTKIASSSAQFGWVGSQGVISVKWAVLTMLSEIWIGPCWGRLQHRKDSVCRPAVWGRAQHRDSGGCPSIPRLEVPQLCFSLLYLSNHCPYAGAQHKCLRASKCVHRLLRRTPRFPGAFCFIWMDRVPAGFHSTCSGASLPSTGVPGWGAWCGAGTLCSSGQNRCSQDSPLDSQQPNMGTGPAVLHL